MLRKRIVFNVMMIVFLGIFALLFSTAGLCTTRGGAAVYGKTVETDRLPYLSIIGLWFP